MDKPQNDAVCIGHEPCPACGSKDNLGRYDDGHGWCFGCGHYEAGDGSKARPRPSPDADVGFLEVTPKAFGKRRLTLATAQKFHYGEGITANGAGVHVAPYYGPDGRLISQHIRTAKKDFFFIGQGSDLPLFGQHLCPPAGKQIVVTEGELDCLSVSQAFGNKWPTVSVPNGAKGAPKAIGRALELLSGYERVVLWFDDDEPGREAATACAMLLPPGKAFIAGQGSGYKDASEALQADRADLIMRAVWDARLYRPDGIVSLSDIRDRVLADLEVGRPWYLPGVTQATFGRRPGDLWGFGGGTGCGKTDLFAEQIAFDVTQLGITCGVLSLEQPVAETGRRLAGKIASKRFHVPDGSWTRDELAATWGALEATNKVFLYDNFGAMDWDTIEAKMRYMVTVQGCQHLYLDHLTALAADEADERKALERIMARFSGLCQSLQVIAHYVSHLATPEGKPHEEGGRVQTKHFKGSRAIQNWSHGMFGIERNTQGETPEERRAVLRCLKDRHTGQGLGKVWPLHYDPTTGRLTEGSPEIAGWGTEEQIGDY